MSLPLEGLVLRLRPEQGGALPCPRCAASASLHPTGRFRVNSNGRRVDVWLLVRCDSCLDNLKLSIERRTPVGSFDPGVLMGYQTNDPDRVREAFDRQVALAAGRRGAGASFRIDGLDAWAAVWRSLRERAVGPAFELQVQVEGPVRVRLDRVLALVFETSRSRVAAILGRHRARLLPEGRDLARRLRRPIEDGTRVVFDAVSPGREPGPGSVVSRWDPGTRSG